MTKSERTPAPPGLNRREEGEGMKRIIGIGVLLAGLVEIGAMRRIYIIAALAVALAAPALGQLGKGRVLSCPEGVAWRYERSVQTVCCAVTHQGGPADPANGLCDAWYDTWMRIERGRAFDGTCWERRTSECAESCAPAACLVLDLVVNTYRR